MTRNYLFLFFLLGWSVIASSQTLFTYGPYKADAREFLRAFEKNNQQPASARSAAMTEYLDLYINSRLKIKEAYARGYDSLPLIKGEVENLRNQIIENYMSDPETIRRLTAEAHQRSLKEIHAAHIFIAAPSINGSQDTVAARKKLDQALARLKKGEDFMKVAADLSDDPSAKTNGGDLNYITVFTLPYEFENLVYSTPVGKYSQPYTSKAGYHIFKNIAERKASGRIKVQHILLAFPPDIDEAGRKARAKLADSLYQRLLKGDDFGKLAAAFSNDFVSAASEGNLPEFGIGQYEPAFEKNAWSLTKDGGLGKPFVTTHGYHILKRVSIRPAVTDPNDAANKDMLQQKVMADDRWKTAKDFIYTRVRSKAGVRKEAYDEAVLWALSDSLLDFKPAGIGRAMNPTSGVLRIGDSVFTVQNWISYAQMHRYKSDRSSLKKYTDLMDEFTRNAMYQYYRAHLEDFNEEFRLQMEEFRDGNLFFEIMQQEVWNKAQTDSAALLALYEKNRSKYNWTRSADAIVFFCTDEVTAKRIAPEQAKNPANWKKLLEANSDKIVADSARYEWEQLPGLAGKAPKEKSNTGISVNPGDNTASFAWIQKVYPQPAPRSFAEAKGLVMNDYQTKLEEDWIKTLRAKYPVVVDKKVFESISK